MEASPKALKDILTGDKKYIVPPYQRPYKWDVENVEQLILDIQDSMGAQEKEYFIGSVICIKKGDDSFEVVDGQQRLITLILILSVLAKKVGEGEAREELRKMISKRNPFDKNFVPIPCLTVQKKVKKVFDRIIRDEENENTKRLPPNQKVFLNNYNKIDKLLSSAPKESLSNFAEYLCYSVKVIFVEVDDRISSFRLFNVLNNRGMPLTDADLIKNLLLSNADDEETESYASKEVENHWSELENIVGEENVDDFLTLHQISKKEDRDRVKKGNFSYYEKELKGEIFENDAVKMSKALCLSAEKRDHYRGEGHPKIKRTIHFLKMLNKSNEWEPAFMAFLNRRHCDKEFVQFAEMFEKVYVHYLLARDAKSQRESVCYHALEAINNDKSFDDILDVIRRLAQNKNLETMLDGNNFYDQSRPSIINIAKSVLLRIEMEQFDDTANFGYDNPKKITIEHILPQNKKDDYWKKRFTDEQHEEWCHKLGNLTLISKSKNGGARNYGFDRKKDAYQKLGQSPFKITTDLCSLPEWNMESLQERHERLKEKLKKLWEIPAELV